MKDETLLPCPFCGSPAEHYPDGGMEGYSIMCSHQNGPCNMLALGYETPEEAERAWNTRATLQSGNSGQPVTVPAGYVLVPVEPTTNQWAAGMQAFDSGMDKVTRVYKAMLAAAPTTPDGWIPVSERMPDKLIPVMVMYEDGDMWSAIWSGQFWDDGCAIPDPHSITHWRDMPDAPQGV